MKAAGVRRFVKYKRKAQDQDQVVKYKRQDQDTWRRELDQQCKPARCLARSCKTYLFFIDCIGQLFCYCKGY